MFIGSCGTGKTHLACSIATAIAAQGLGLPKYMTMVQAVRFVKQTYSKASTMTETQAIQKLIEPDLLILDEVGIQHNTNAEKIIINEIINGRYNDMKCTLLISNLTIDGFKEFLGERVIDRMKEGSGLFINFTGDSFRDKK